MEEEACQLGMHHDTRTETYVLGLLILRHSHAGLTPETGELNRGDFLIKQTSLLSRLGFLVGPNGVVILLFPAEIMVLSTLLCLQAHELLLTRIGQTILHDSVHQGLVAILRTGAKVRKIVGGVRHGLGTTGHNDIRIARHDRLGSEDDGLQAGGAHLVDGGAHRRLLKASAEGALSSGVLSDTFIRGGISISRGYWRGCRLTWRKGRCRRTLPGRRRP